jgi:DNA-binding NarL/FixJ family response regulator/anti-sigma regulatory factor (Ser/Thr protein kinase)
MAVSVETVRVLVVDDSSSTRTMLREALGLGGGIEVVGEAGTGREAIQKVGDLGPDVVLMDVRMPDGDGVEAARTIVTRHPGTRVVALTWSDDPSTVREMLAAGAMGYVVKGGTIDELTAAIFRAAGGEPELDQRVLPAAVDDLRRLLEEERERRQQVERLARARSEFVQILSHELRTPLTVIFGALRMLQQRGVDAEVAPVVDSALRRSGELEFLIEGMELATSEPTGEGLADARNAVDAASRRLQAHLDRIEADHRPWAGVPQRFVDRAAFELISNAVRHGQPPIEVSAMVRGPDGILEVANAGDWVPPTDDFSAFFQGDMSATRTRGGFGLGLFIVSRLCAACDGDIAIGARGGRTVATARFRLRPNGSQPD